MTDEPKPLGEIELGLSVEQAVAIVTEFDALWQAAAWYGKKKQKELLTLRNTLAHAVRTPGQAAVSAAAGREGEHGETARLGAPVGGRV